MHMNATFEEIAESIRTLRPGDRYQLWVQLNEEFDPTTEDEKEIEAAWDKEIEQRVKDVQEGHVALLSGEESDRWLGELRGRLEKSGVVLA